jgi:hypothetical protein
LSIAVTELSIAVTELSIAVTELSIAVTELSIAVTELSIAVTELCTYKCMACKGDFSGLVQFSLVSKLARRARECAGGSRGQDLQCVANVLLMCC